MTTSQLLLSHCDFRGYIKNINYIFSQSFTVSTPTRYRFFFQSYGINSWPWSWWSYGTVGVGVAKIIVIGSMFKKHSHLLKIQYNFFEELIYRQHANLFSYFWHLFRSLSKIFDMNSITTTSVSFLKLLNLLRHTKKTCMKRRSNTTSVSKQIYICFKCQSSLLNWLLTDFEPLKRSPFDLPQILKVYWIKVILNLLKYILKFCRDILDTNNFQDY